MQPNKFGLKKKGINVVSTQSSKYTKLGYSFKKEKKVRL